MSRSHKHSCGCYMCKPWKHGAESKYSSSERRRLQDEPDWSEEDERDLMLAFEADEALSCHYFGPCDRCKKGTPEF